MKTKAAELSAEELDQPLSTTQFADLLLDHQPSASSWWRWMSGGIAGIRLACIYIAGRRRITPRMWLDWLAAVNAAKQKKAARPSGKDRAAAASGKGRRRPRGRLRKSAA